MTKEGGLHMRNFEGAWLAHRHRLTLTDLFEELVSDREALALFEEFHPGLWDDIAEQGYRCLALEQLPRARQIFAFLVEMRPDEPAYHAAYADAQAGMKDYLEAASGYYQTAELAPEVPDAHFYLAEIWLFFQHKQQALERLLQVQDLLASNSSHRLFDKMQVYLAHAKTP